MDSTTPPLASIGIDIGKEVFHVVGFGADGKIAFRRKIKRLALAETFRKLPPCVVGMEACLSAHFVSRSLRQLGHEPRIIPAIYVKPFVKGQKNDYNDAEAIAEAALRPNLRTVREKTQDLHASQQACHRSSQQARPHRLERAAEREGIRHSSSRGHSHLSWWPSTKFANEDCMERIDRRALSLMTQRVACQPVR